MEVIAMAYKVNIDGLKENAKKKHNESMKKAEDAIVYLLQTNQSINFSSVAKHSNLSRSFLYKNEYIRSIIEKHRGYNYFDNRKTYKKEVKTDKSKDTIIAAKDLKIEALEKEIEELKNKIKKYQSMIYERI